MNFLNSYRMVALLLILSKHLTGQSSYSFQNFSKKNGLSQASVFAIAQDDAGFMWFGTRDGLNKYDGYKFKVYRNSDSENPIAGNDIRTLFFDNTKNELWLGANSGLSKYQAKTDDFLNFSASIEHSTNQ